MKSYAQLAEELVLLAVLVGIVIGVAKAALS